MQEKEKKVQKKINSLKNCVRIMEVDAKEAENMKKKTFLNGLKVKKLYFLQILDVSLIIFFD